MVGLSLPASPWILGAPAVFAVILMVGAASHLGGPRPTPSRRAHRAARCPAACLLACFAACGAVVGAAASTGGAVACLGEPGALADIHVEGRVTGRPAPLPGGRLRLRLGDATVARAGVACPGGRAVLASVASDTTVRMGDVVHVRGSWRPGSGRAGRLDGHVVSRSADAGLPVALRLRRSAGRRIETSLPGDVAPTALALVVAERDELSADLRRRFVAAGMAHLLAISGLHVGLIYGAVVTLLRYVAGRAASLLLALGAVTAYVVVIGAPVSAVRALFIIAGYAWAGCRGWPARPGELLGVALIGTVLLDPASLPEPGMQLSFCGFAGVLVGDRLGRLLSPGPSTSARLARSLVVGAAAMLATSPVTAFHFGQVTPASLPAHLAAGPFVGLALASILATVASPEFLAPIPAAVATGSLRSLHVVAESFAGLPGGMRAVAAPSLFAWVAWLLVGTAALRVLRSGRPVRGLAPLCMAAAVFALPPSLHVRRYEHTLLCTLSVGQGDAAVVRTRRGRWLVFDGGPTGRSWDAGRRVVAPFIRRHGGSSVDLVVLSHPDLDHLGGLTSLLDEFPVGAVLDTGDPVPSEAYADFLRAVERAGIPWRPVRAGDRLNVDEADLLVLGPRDADRPGRGGAREPPVAEVNATSLSFRLEIGGFRYLNTGDAGIAEEADILRTWPPDSVRSDLLKVGHHGSKGSTGAPWLEATRPTLAVISAGAGNRYGHPHRLVLARLRLAGADVWRTDRLGPLCLDVDAIGRWRVSGEGAWRTPSR